MKMEYEYLPLDMIIPILMLLPVKSLLRFKCICKSWLSLISDPLFAKSHFELAADAPTYRLLLHTYNNGHPCPTLSIDFDDAPSLHSHSASTPLNPPSFLSPETCYEIKGSCRGFLLLEIGRKDLYLWNPSTDSHKLIPLSFDGVSVSDFDSKIFYQFLFGFGYDPSTDDYLVLLANWGSTQGDYIYFDIFSVRANSWSVIDGVTKDGNYYMSMNYGDRRPGILYNGNLHWLVYGFEGFNIILAFDLTERTFSGISLPAGFTHGMHLIEIKEGDLCVIGGLLGLYFSIDFTCETWVMERYKDETSWTKSTVVDRHHITNPISSTKSGDIIGKDGLKLVKYNANGQLFRVSLLL